MRFNRAANLRLHSIASYGRGAGVGRGLDVGSHLPVHGVGVAVGVGDAVGVGVGDGPESAQYIPPFVVYSNGLIPPHTIISSPIKTAL